MPPKQMLPMSLWWDQGTERACGIWLWNLLLSHLRDKEAAFYHRGGEKQSIWIKLACWVPKIHKCMQSVLTTYCSCRGLIGNICKDLMALEGSEDSLLPASELSFGCTVWTWFSPSTPVISTTTPVQPVLDFLHKSKKFYIICLLEMFISAALLLPWVSSLNPAALSAFGNSPDNSACA